MNETPFCSVKPSKIHGLGLFGWRQFNQGDVVAQYNPSDWQRITWHDLLNNEAWIRLWFIRENDEYARIAPNTSTFMRANHNHEPNTIWEPDHCRLVAKFLILPGREITYDYALREIPDHMQEQHPIWLRPTKYKSRHNV